MKCHVCLSVCMCVCLYLCLYVCMSVLLQGFEPLLLHGFQTLLAKLALHILLGELLEECETCLSPSISSSLVSVSIHMLVITIGKHMHRQIPSMVLHQCNQCDKLHTSVASCSPCAPLEPFPSCLPLPSWGVPLRMCCVVCFANKSHRKLLGVQSSVRKSNTQMHPCLVEGVA